MRTALTARSSLTRTRSRRPMALAPNSFPLLARSWVRSPRSASWGSTGRGRPSTPQPAGGLRPRRSTCSIHSPCQHISQGECASGKHLRLSLSWNTLQHTEVRSPSFPAVYPDSYPLIRQNDYKKAHFEMRSGEAVHLQKPGWEWGKARGRATLSLWPSPRKVPAVVYAAICFSSLKWGRKAISGRRPLEQQNTNET